jgi:amidophosphoribosyltransferase
VLFPLGGENPRPTPATGDPESDFQPSGISMEDKLREECGVFGVWGHPEASRLTYLGLYSLQHRGQESVGIVTSDGERLHSVREMGHVSEVLTEPVLAKLIGPNAIGHVRYSTAGDVSVNEAQPFSIKCHRGEISVCHNGNLPFADELRHELEAEGAIFSSTSDTEVVLHKLARSRKPTLYEAVVETFNEIEGAYSILILTPDALIAVRDARGFRPMCLGQLDGAYVVASETCAFDLIGAEYLRDIQPGEVVYIDRNGLRTEHPLPEREPAFCIFEHVYFSRPDSIIYGRSVNKSRHKMGKQLAREHPVEADLIVPVPDSGVSAAIGFSAQSGINFRFGLVRNHYVGRTFIEPKQSIRHFGVKVKLNPVRDLIEGRRVVLVDDSLVRGTTSKKIVEMIRQAGAKEVHLRISCPPTMSSCYYGVDTPTSEELIAANHSIEEIRQFIGADSLGYLSHEGLLTACGADEGLKFCTACYTGKYPLAIPARPARVKKVAGGK